MRRLRRTRPDSIDVAVGARIRRRRTRIRMSRSRLAKALGVTFAQVQKYENGSNRIAASTLVRIAELLETSVAAIVGERRGRAAANTLLQTLGAAPEAIDLLTAYGKIDDAGVRRSLLTLATRLQALGVSPDVVS